MLWTTTKKQHLLGEDARGLQGPAPNNGSCSITNDHLANRLIESRRSGPFGRERVVRSGSSLRSSRELLRQPTKALGPISISDNRSDHAKIYVRNDEIKKVNNVCSK